jgi:hypothetical protein
VYDLLDEVWIMAAIVRHGWTRFLVFGVGWSDENATENTKFENEELHSHELGVTIGLATQYFQGMGNINVRRHGRVS